MVIAMPRAPICLVMAAALFAGKAAAQESAKPLLTPKQRQEVAALIMEFRKVRGHPAQRRAVIERAGKIAPVAVSQVLDVVRKELDPQLADYRQQFLRAAAAVIAERTAPEKAAEIKQLRDKVLDLSQQEALTKEEIFATSDPALARLKELILVSREDILRASPKLAAARDNLQARGREWELCATLILAAEKEDQAKAAAAAQAGKTAEGSAEWDSTPSFEKYLVKDEEMATALATPMSEATRRTLARNAQLAGQLDGEEARCVLDMNLTRMLLGLDALTIDPKLTAAARDHSKDMQEQNFFEHESPLPGKKTPWDRTERFGTTASGENIAMGTLDGAVANEMWWHSPGHHRNMLGDHQRVGLGRHNHYWTELFGR
jgi:uncharacterized protein YkwD